MALINCKECGKEISDSAKMCPNCGCPTELGTKTAQLKGMSVGILVAILLSIVGLILFITSVGPMADGIGDHGFIDWFDRHEGEALGVFLRFCFGVGMAIGSAIYLFKIKAQANYLAGETAASEYENSDCAAPVEIDYNSCSADTWICSCGRRNASYVSTCACGVSKRNCKK